MATLKQALALLLAKADPPWSTQPLRVIFKRRPLSLRAVIKAVDAQKILLFIQVRPLLLFAGVSTEADLISRWNAPTAVKDINGILKPNGTQIATIGSLSDNFRPLGVSIVYVSKDAGTIGIKGTYAAFLQIQALKLVDPNASPGGQNQSGIGNLAQAAAAEGAGFGALAAASASTGLVAGALVVGAFLGFVAAGLFLAVGLYELIAGAASPAKPVSNPPLPVSNPPFDDPELPDLTLGSVPDGLPTQIVDQFFEDMIGEDPEPGQLPGAGDLGGDPGGDGTGIGAGIPGVTV